MSVISVVESRFIRKLEDVVARKGEHVLIMFSTYDTGPDLVHYFPNGTNVTLVSSGTVHPSQCLNTRCNVTSTKRESGGYNISLEINPVQPQDAGTYLAKDDNDNTDSENYSVEFIVTGKPSQNESSSSSSSFICSVNTSEMTVAAKKSLHEQDVPGSL